VFASRFPGLPKVIILILASANLGACGSGGNGGNGDSGSNDPVASAGPNQSVDEQSAVNLDGTASSDPGGAIASYSWAQTVGTVVVLNNASTASPNFTAPSVSASGETLTFELTVTDGPGETDTDTVEIQVNNDPAQNILPTADAGPDQTVGEGAGVTLDGGASSDDGSITDYAWTQTAGTAVAITNADQVTAIFTSPTGPETLTFQLEVTDDEGGMASDLVDIDISVQMSVSVSVSGKVTFHEIPHGVPGSGLDYTSIIEMPARLVTVQAIDAADDVTVEGQAGISASSIIRAAMHSTYSIRRISTPVQRTR